MLSKSEIDPFEILAEVIAKLKNHDCKETKGCILEDKTQIGYFQMIEVNYKQLNSYRKWLCS